MPRKWTPEQRMKHAAKTADRWHEQVRKNPAAHSLAKARVKRELTQAELAELSGVAVGTIAAIEGGRSVARFTKERLSRALALPDEELFG
jgi:DNA-binding XRE family transcriptional regulator